MSSAHSIIGLLAYATTLEPLVHQNLVSFPCPRKLSILARFEWPPDITLTKGLVPSLSQSSFDPNTCHLTLGGARSANRDYPDGIVSQSAVRSIAGLSPL